MLAEFLNRLIPHWIIENDSYKVAGKGLFQRFVQILGDELDEYQYDKIKNFPAYTFSSMSADREWVDYIANALGSAPLINDDDEDFTHFVNSLIGFYQIRGTIASYERILPIVPDINAATITELPRTNTTYDESPAHEFDEETLLRYDDTECTDCIEYSIDVSVDSEDNVLTVDSYQKLLIAIRFLQPVNATLKEITVNGEPLAITPIIVVIVGDDLTYDNSGDPTTTLELVNEELIISGPNSSRYSLGDDGNLYYDTSITI